MVRWRQNLRLASNRVLAPFGIQLTTFHGGVVEAYPAGHYYSVVPNSTEIKEFRASTFYRTPTLAGIDLRLDSQRSLLAAFQEMQEDVPFYSLEKRLRFDIENDTFSYDDAPILHYMMRTLKPRNIIEVGSGWSSACMLDTSDKYLGSSVKCTFIDPYCDNLRGHLLPGDENKVKIIERKVQSIDLDLFNSLGENDILFIDSSHVVKLGGDLVTIIFNILPMLASGVVIHFHDVRFPFRYPESLVENGVLWNEAYFLRAFLMYNNNFEIMFWLNSLLNTWPDNNNSKVGFLPLDSWSCRFNESKSTILDAGGSIYLRKVC